MADTNRIPDDYGPKALVLVLACISLCFLDNLFNAGFRQKQHQIIIGIYNHIRISAKYYICLFFNRKEGQPALFPRSFLDHDYILSTFLILGSFPPYPLVMT